MTLITTFINQLGIVQASDSNLTDRNYNVGTGPKLFDINVGGGVLAVAGAYSVGGTSFDTWIATTIEDYAMVVDQTLGGFAEFLGRRLDANATRYERSAGSLIHIAGYAYREGKARPELWVVRNVEGIHPITGDYFGRTAKYQVTEDFWTR